MRISSSRISRARTSPGAPAAASPQALEPADTHGVGAQRDGLDHVGPAHEAAVDDDRGAPGHGGDHFGQHVEGPPAVVELAPAVIGHVDALHAVLAGEEASSAVAMPLRISGMSWVSLKRLTWSQESAAWKLWPVARTRHGLTKRRARSRSRRL